MESGAKGCEVIVSGKLRAARAKSMKFKDGYMVSSGYPALVYIDAAVRHVLLRQGVLGIKVRGRGRKGARGCGFRGIPAGSLVGSVSSLAEAITLSPSRILNLLVQVKIMKDFDPTGKRGPRMPLPDVVKVRLGDWGLEYLTHGWFQNSLDGGREDVYLSAQWAAWGGLFFAPHALPGLTSTLIPFLLLTLMCLLPILFPCPCRSSSPRRTSTFPTSPSQARRSTLKLELKLTSACIAFLGVSRCNTNVSQAHWGPAAWTRERMPLHALAMRTSLCIPCLASLLPACSGLGTHSRSLTVAAFWGRAVHFTSESHKSHLLPQ
jgi:hypothetical protein